LLLTCTLSEDRFVKTELLLTDDLFPILSINTNELDEDIRSEVTFVDSPTDISIEWAVDTEIRNTIIRVEKTIIISFLSFIVKIHSIPVLFEKA